MQECLAIAGIAAGVALLFASQVASPSLRAASVSSHAGSSGARRCSWSRAPERLPGSAAQAACAGSAGVRVAAPILEATAQRGRARAAASRSSSSAPIASLPSSAARSCGAPPARTVRRHRRGRAAGAAGAHDRRDQVRQEATFQAGRAGSEARRLRAAARRQIGALVASPIAIAPLFYAQELAGLQGRVSRILVAPAPGAQARGAGGLAALAAGRLNVESTDYDEKLFAKRPRRRATSRRRCSR